jgi:hypothetical protein
MADIDQINKQWRYRRGMAIFCLGTAVSIGLFRYFTPLLKPDLLTTLQASDDFLRWFIIPLLAHTVSYMGLATLDDIKRGSGKSLPRT